MQVYLKKRKKGEKGREGRKSDPWLSDLDGCALLDIFIISHYIWISWEGICNESSVCCFLQFFSQCVNVPHSLQLTASESLLQIGVAY